MLWLETSTTRKDCHRPGGYKHIEQAISRFAVDGGLQHSMALGHVAVRSSII